MDRVRARVPSLALAAVLTSSTLTGLVMGLTPAAAADTATAGGNYVVSFADAATVEDVATARDRAVAAGAEVRYDYDTALSGFAALLPEAALTELRGNPLVASIEADEVITIDSTQRGPTAGLDRIDQRSSRLNGRFRYAATGKGVTAYVIDTGVMAGHSEFRGRVEPGRSFTSSAATTDCGEGHGTHVAGVIGGERYGVAKDVTIVPVKVFSCSGAASVSTVIAGIEWATEDSKRRRGPTVANLSAGVDRRLGRGMERAVGNAISAGLPFVTAAGNDGGSACSQSPARLPAAITVGAVNRADRLAAFSNYGKCVDLFAPGVDVRSAGIESSTDTDVKDGTSMAAPYVTGVIAAFLQRVPAAGPAKVRTALIEATTRGALRAIGSSPNRMLFNGLRLVNKAPVVRKPAISLPGRGRTVGLASVPVWVSWRGSDPDGSISRYQLQRSTDGGRHWRNVALPTAKSRSVTVNLGSDTGHRFRVRAVDDLGRRSEWRATDRFGLDIDQQGQAKLRRGWSSTAGSDLSGGSALWTSSRGAAATYTFRGRSIRWIGSTGADHGRAKVYLDGRLVATVDAWSATRQTCRVLFAKTLKPGKHTLRIVVLGQANSRATGKRVDIDAFVVSS